MKTLSPSRRVVFTLALGWLICGPSQAESQTVDSVAVRTFSSTLPAQACEVVRRPASGVVKGAALLVADAKKGPAATRDTVMLVVRSSDGSAFTASPVAYSVWLNGAWQGARDKDDKSKDPLIISAPAKTLAGDTLTVRSENGQVCLVVLAPVEEKDNSGAGITFRFGPEFTSANAFAADKRLAATAGVRWDLVNSRLFPTYFSWLKVSQSVIGTFDYTSAVATREYSSCRGTAVSSFQSGGTLVPPRDGTVCGPPVFTTVARAGGAAGALDTTKVTYTVIGADSIRAQALPTWRAVFTWRGEIGLLDDMRIGPVLGAVVQTDPRGLRAAGMSNTNRPLRPTWLRGVGLRKVTSDGTEVFAVDLVFGGVQGYYEIDRVITPRVDGKPDSLLKIGPDPVVVDPSLQWQTNARLRLFKGASLRAYATFNAPQDGLLVSTGGFTTAAPRSRGFPDLVRIAFLLDRDLKKVWDTMIGADGAKEGGGTNTADAAKK